MSPSKVLPLFGFVLIYLLSVLPARSQMPSSLRPGVPIERTLGPGERHSFRINLEQDQLLQLTVDQRGIDVVVRVFSPTGKNLGEFDSPNGDEGPEDVSLIAATSGVYRIEVAPLEDGEKVTAGRYEIKILELRAATQQELDEGSIQMALKAKGLALLGELAGSLQQIHLPETRVRAQLQAAQLLWESDEKRATKLVQDAMDGVREYLSAVDMEDESYYQGYQTGMQLRYEVLQILAPRDPETALNFLISTRVLVDPNGEQNNAQANQELQFELTLASQMSARNPKHALQIAEESLKKGYSSGLIDTVTRLRNTDSESAVKLAQEIAAKLQGEKLLKNQEAANLAVSLLQMAHAPARRNQSSASNTALLTDDEYRELFNKALSEALSYTAPPTNFYSPERNAAQNILSSLKSMTGELEGYAPGSAALVEKKANEFNSPPDPRARVWQKYQEQINSGSLEVGLEAISRAPREMINQLAQQLAMKACNAGDFARARQILTDYISNPFQRRRALANLDQQIIYSAIAKGKIEEALRSLSNFRTPRARATMVSQIVNQIGPGQKKANVLRFLEQARNMLGAQVQAEDQERMNALCEIGRAFLRYDPKRGFEVVEPLLEQFNEMSTAAVLLNGFGQQYYQDGELMMQNGNALGNFAYQLSQTLGTLAIANFDRAKAGADTVQRPEVRLNVYLSIAQHAINPEESGIRALFKRR